MRCLHLAMWVTIGYFGLGLTTASAYLDPGTGSMILQAVIGAVAGALIVIKLYWYKLVAFFKGRRPGDAGPAENNRNDGAGDL
jgi:hypothetical protein